MHAIAYQKEENSELVILYIILLSRGSNPAPPADNKTFLLLLGLREVGEIF
jgi:hypothetical protein